LYLMERGLSRRRLLGSRGNGCIKLQAVDLADGQGTPLDLYE
jgi:hypothetical protein